MVTVIISGNHDSGTRHEIFKTPWAALGVHAIGLLDKDNPENHIVKIPGKGWVVGMPYVHDRAMPEGFIPQLLEKVDELNREGLPVVLAAHTTVRGFDFKGHDDVTDFSVGGIDYVSLEEFGSGYDYLALGHIHKPQTIKSGKLRARYSGSILPVSFDEMYAHSVSLIEIDNHGDEPAIRTIDIDNKKPVITLGHDAPLGWDDMKKMVSEFPDETDAFLRLMVEVDDFLPPDAPGEIAEVIKGKKCRICQINSVRKREKTKETSSFTLSEFSSQTPLDILRRFAEHEGIVFDQDLEDMFRQAEKEID